jgi:transposase
MRPAPDLSRIARVRLAMLDWHRSHGENVARTARHFGYSRPTVYRWLARFERFRLESLEDRSSRPVRRRRPTWTLAQLVAVRRQRERYPRWGKDKLAVLLRREGIGLSVSMVGRILGRLRATGELREQARGGSAPGGEPGGGPMPSASRPVSSPRGRAISSRSTRSTCGRCRVSCSSSSRRAMW